MKKSAWVALLVLAVLAGVYFATNEEPQKTVRAPMTIDEVDKLSRVEIVPPASGDESELIVLEKSDGTWQMTRPVQSELSEAAKARLTRLFDEETRTDDLQLDPAKKADYGLDEASAVKLSAYAEASDNAAVELEVGREITVEQTGARRTYVKKPGKDKIYRAQMGIGDFVRQSADDFRSKKMVDLDRKAIDQVTIVDQDGATTKITRDKGDNWALAAQLEGDQTNKELDQGKTQRLVNSLVQVRANGFADDKKPAEVGLEPARVTITLDTIDDEQHTLLVGDETEDGNVYVQFDDGTIFTVAKSLAERWTPNAANLEKNKEAKADKTAERPNQP